MIPMYGLTFGCLSAVMAFVCGVVAADDEIVVSPPILLDPIVDDDSWALEFAGTARRIQVNGQWHTDVVGVWMLDRSDNPEPQGITIRTALSTDGGTNWTIDEFTSPTAGQLELDPFATFDPVSKSIYIGGISGGGRNRISRLDPGDTEFSALMTIRENEPDNFHRPSAGAGPKPGAPTEHRIYVIADYGLVWLDELGQTDTWVPEENPPFSELANAIPRVGYAGQLYLGHLGFDQGLSRVRVQRSIALDNGAPVFLDHSSVAAKPVLSMNWIPTDLRIAEHICTAVAPHDGDRVYVVYLDRTSEEDNDCDGTNVNVDLYFTMTEDATANTNGSDDVVWDSDPSDLDADAPRIIPSGVEVPGDQFYPWLEATTYQTAQGPRTRLHLTFFDSRHNPDQCDDDTTTDAFLIDMYYATSDDEGLTWSEHRLTPVSFDVDGAIELSNFFGDYGGMAAAGKRAFAFYPIVNGTFPDVFTEAHASMITLGDIASTIDLAAVEGTISGSDDVSLITSSNDQRLVIGDTSASGGVFKTIVDVEFDTDYTSANADDEIDIRVECHAAEANVTGPILLKNQNAGGGFEEWLVFDVPQSTDGNTWKRLIPAVQGSGLAQKDYISSTGRIDVRLEMTRDQTPSPDGLISRYDFVQVQVIDN
jgi:hypothetical protein